MLLNVLNNTPEHAFEEELLSIFGSTTLETYEQVINQIYLEFERTFATLTFRENERATIVELIAYFKALSSQTKGTVFFYFLAFSLHNILVYEKFNRTTEENAIKKNLAVYEAVSLLEQELHFFLDFLAVSGSFSRVIYKERSIKKFIFRVLVQLMETSTFLKKEKKPIINEAKKHYKMANFIEYVGLPRPKQLGLLFKISKVPPFLKKKGDIYIIGFYYYQYNTYALGNKKFKVASKPSAAFVELLEKQGSTKFYINQELLAVIKALLEKENIEDLDELNNQLKRAIRKKNQKVEAAAAEDKPFVNLALEKLKIKQIQKKINISTDYVVFHFFVKTYGTFTGALYFIPFSDFRGRIYYKSVASPQASWLYRFSYHFGVTEQVTSQIKSKLQISQELLEKIKQTFKNIEKPALLWTLLSLGFKLKSQLFFKNFKIDTETLVRKGLETYLLYAATPSTVFTTVTDKMDAIEIVHYINILTTLNSNSNSNAYYIIKDTTASVYQHLGKLLGFKNETALIYTNLLDETGWYDTYGPIIDVLTKDVDSSIVGFFTRKSIKKIIMTSKYNVEFDAALKYFHDEIDFVENPEKYKKILKEFSRIFRILKAGIAEEKILYHSSLKAFNRKISTEFFFKVDDLQIDLRYFQPEKVEICIFFNKNRHVLVHYETTKQVDFKKMSYASLPNIIHALDALYCRRIIKKTIDAGGQIFTIHDSFAVPFNNIDLLIQHAREAFKINEQFECSLSTNKNIEVTSIYIII